jgi:hypothetical protein
MRKLIVATAALIGASFLATSGSAMPVNPGIAAFTPESSVTQVDHRWNGNWKGKRRFRHRHRFDDDDDGFRFGFGFPLLFGLGVGLGHAFHDRDDVDCIGRWHRHRRGWHCHGRLVYD